MDAKQNVAQQVSGAKKPRSFILTAESQVYNEQHKIIREDIHQNAIAYEFPEGFNDLDLMEECRALQDPDDFDLMFDIMMQMLNGKPVVIYIKNRLNKPVKVCEFQVTDRYQNLRGNEFIDANPVVILWMTQFISGHLLKKYPTLGNENNGTTRASKDRVPKGMTAPKFFKES